jgi:hypothetical protein
MSVRVEGVCDHAETERARGRWLNAVDGVGESLERVCRFVGVSFFVGVASVGGGNWPG